MGMKKEAAVRPLEERVEEAIRDLVAEGVEPTVKRILGRTGGSYRDICPIAKAVKARIDEEQAMAAAAPEMPDALRRLSDTVWQTAWGLADEATAECRAARAADREAFEKREAELVEAVGDVERQRDDALTRAEKAEADAAEAKEANAQLSQRLRDAEARLAEREDLMRAVRAELRLRPAAAPPETDEAAPTHDASKEEPEAGFRQQDLPMGSDSQPRVS